MKNREVTLRDVRVPGTAVFGEVGGGLALAQHFEKDLVHSREIHASGWRRRGLLQRLAEQLPKLIGRYL